MGTHSATVAATVASDPAAAPAAGTAAAERSAADHPTADLQLPPSHGPETPISPGTPIHAATPTREAVLALMLRHGELTAAELSRSLGVSVQAMRRHLRGLEDAGLVQASSTTQGPGRPSNRWHLTAKAQEQFPDGSEDFALGLLESMAGVLPADTIERLLTQQAHQKAAAYRARIGQGSLHQRLERLVDLRRGEGFVAECSPDPEGKGWLMREFHCSVMRIAERFPCVCDQELRLIRQTFPDCTVERVHWRLEKGHSCGFRLRPTTQESQATPA